MRQHFNGRRQLLKNLATLGTMSALVPAFTGALASGPPDNSSNRKVLFQGDSITDGNRSRNSDWNHVMGHGYQYIIASKLWYELPAKQLHFFNRGVSGNKVPDLSARWQEDTIDIKPDLLSILVGINDIAALIGGNENFSSAAYETGLRDLLVQTKRALPAVELVLCEPFLLPVGKIKDNWAVYAHEAAKRQAIVKDLSEAHKAVFVPFQSVFNKALLRAPADYWIWDGIHPMPAGHELMAREWMKQVNAKLQFFK